MSNINYIFCVSNAEYYTIWGDTSFLTPLPTLHRCYNCQGTCMVRAIPEPLNPESILADDCY